MDEKLFPVYKEIEDRLVKISWTHKVQEIQAGLHLKKSSCHKWWMAITNGITTTTAFITVVTSALDAVNAAWVWPAITSVIAVVSTIFTLRFKDGLLDDKAMACKQYAAKCRDIRNRYEAILADVKAGRYNVDTLCVKRDEMTEVENRLFAGEIAPHTTAKAVALAKKALLEDKDSLTEEREIKAIVPTHLQKLQ